MNGMIGWNEWDGWMKWMGWLDEMNGMVVWNEWMRCQDECWIDKSIFGVELRGKELNCLLISEKRFNALYI